MKQKKSILGDVAKRREEKLAAKTNNEKIKTAAKENRVARKEENKIARKLKAAERANERKYKLDHVIDSTERFLSLGELHNVKSTLKYIEKASKETELSYAFDKLQNNVCQYGSAQSIYILACLATKPDLEKLHKAILKTENKKYIKLFEEDVLASKKIEEATTPVEE